MVCATTGAGADGCAGERRQGSSTETARDAGTELSTAESGYDYVAVAGVCGVAGDVLFFGELLPSFEAVMGAQIYFHTAGG